MKLNRAIFTLTALALVSSAAQAQTAVGAGSYNISPTSATVSQTINVTVPKRFGLHLHRSSWTLDLGAVDADGNYGTTPAGVGSADEANCVRAGDHSSGASGTGRDFLYYAGTASGTSSKDAKILSLLNGATYEGDQYADTAGNVYSYTGNLLWPAPLNPRTGSGVAGVGGTIDLPIGGYPGFYTTGSGTGTVLEWKGPIMCSFQTIVQKFSNSSSGFNFNAQLTAGASSTFPLPLYVRDILKTPVLGVTTSSAVLSTGNATASTLATGVGEINVTTGGWLDDHLLQVLVFDGTETNGNYVGNVTYTLTDTTPL